MMLQHRLASLGSADIRFVGLYELGSQSLIRSCIESKTISLIRHHCYRGSHYHGLHFSPCPAARAGIRCLYVRGARKLTYRVRQRSIAAAP